MENKAHAFVAGAFVIGVIGLIVALVLWFTRDQAVRNIYELSTSDPVSGLQPQATVRYRGISVGKVASIDFDPKVRGNVRVRIAVDERVPLTKSSYAALSYQGVTGLATIALNDDGSSQEPLKPDNGNPPRIPLKPSTLAMLQERGEAILDRVESLLGEANQKRVADTLENFAQAAASANQLTKRLDATVKDNLDPALKAIPPLAENAKTTLGSVKQAAGDVSRVAGNLNATVTRLNAPDGALDRLATGTQGLGQAVDSFNTSTLPRVNRVADETSHAVRKLGRAAENINENPQSLLFGTGSALPGPGEAGFSAPAAETAARP